MTLLARTLLVFLVASAVHIPQSNAEGVPHGLAGTVPDWLVQNLLRRAWLQFAWLQAAWQIAWSISHK